METDEQTRRPTGWHWPVLIVAFLGGQAALGAVTIYLAVSDPSHAIEPDYYRRGLEWDAEKARRHASAALGWEAELRVDGSAVELRLCDRDGVGIEGAEVELRAFHHARGNDVRILAGKPAGTGTHAFPVRLDRVGLWRFAFEARRGKDVFLWEVDRVVGSE